MMETIQKMSEGGALEGYSESDWIMGGLVDWDKVPNLLSRKIYQYNQDEYKFNTCTIYQCMSARSYLIQEEISLDKRKEIVDKAIELGLDTSIGRWVHKAVKLISDVMGGVSYISVVLGSDDYWEAVSRNYRLISGYGGNRTYNNDRDDNSRVDANSRGKQSYAHCIGLQDTIDHKVVDNYSGRASNIYEMPNLQNKIKESKQMFYNAYFYISKITLPMGNLPIHTPSTEYKDEEDKEIVLAREQELGNFITNGGKPIFRKYTGKHAMTRMITELTYLRTK